MAWYNPSTWAPVDAIQDSLGTLNIGNAGTGFGGSGLSTQPRTVSSGGSKTASQPQQPSGAFESAPQTTTYAYDPEAAAAARATALAREQDNAFLDAQEGNLRSLLSRADTTFAQGITNLDNSYNKSRNEVTDTQNRTMRDYGVKREDTTRGKDSAIGKVNTNARTLADSVRRILGLASGSGSSAYQLAAPNAIGRQASQQRTGVLETYGRNFRDLDTAEGDAKVKFENLLKDLKADRDQRELDLRTSIADRKNNITSSLANIAGERARVSGGGYNDIRTAQQPFQTEINARNAEIDSLFSRFNPTISYAPVEVQQPELSQYTVDRAAINANKAMGTENYSPYSQYLKKRNQEAL